jgi:hypothetical protein
MPIVEHKERECTGAPEIGFAINFGTIVVKLDNKWTQEKPYIIDNKKVVDSKHKS